MPKKKDTTTSKETPKGEVKPTRDVQAKNVIEQYKRGYDALNTVRNTWDEKEAMLINSLEDSLSKQQNRASQVFDPRLSTIVFERAARVMAQIPTGKVRSLTKKDKGKSLMMGTILSNYVIPNANTQHDILTKFKLVDVYSLVYGSFGILVDYMIKDNYIGPDFHMIPVRDLVPQAGKVSVKDADYMFVRSTVSRKWLLKRDPKSWKNIDKLMEKLPAVRRDSKDQSYVEKKFDRYDFNQAMMSDAEDVEIITKYENDRWTTFSQDGNIILRDIANPHKTDKIPVVVKHAFPLLDRFHGLGEFERGKSLQYAVNSLINLYLDGVKMSIYPPLKVFLSDVVARTIVNEPGAKWVLKNNNVNAVSQMQVSPTGINTFQSTYNFLIAALLNQAGTTDTTVSKETDITQGKTPQALKQTAMRENSRDNWDRFMMERTIEDTFDLFIDLVAQKQEKPIKMQLFDEDLKAVASQMPDALEMFDSKEGGELVVKPQDIKGSYKYFIDMGTTLKKDEIEENQNLTSIIGLIMKLPGAVEQVANMGKIRLGDKEIDFAELLKRFIITSGVQDSEKIIGEVSPETLQQEEAQKAQQMQEQAMAQPPMGPPGMPQGTPSGMPQGAPPQANFENPDMQQALLGGQQPPQPQQGGLSPQGQQIMEELNRSINGG